MTRLTPLGLAVLSLAGWALVLAVVSGRAELVVLTVPLLVGLRHLARADPPPAACAVAHAVSAERVFEGDRVTVTLTLRAASTLPLVEVLEPLPPTVRAVAGRNRCLLGLRRGAPAEWRYQLECVRRGPVRLGTVHLRVWDRAGLRARELTVHEPKLVRVYPRPFPLRHLPRPRRTQTSVGNYVARSVGEGLEPGDIRAFVPGDRVRHVNWRASRRWGRLFVTQYQQERNADVVLMVDSLSEVGVPPVTTVDVAVRAAASLAAAYLGRKDRVGLIEYGGMFRWVRPGSGRVHHERLLDALVRVDILFSYVVRDIALVPRRILPPQALIVAISSLLDPRFENAVVDLAARGFDVAILSPSPIPLVRRAVRPSAMADLAARLWAIERRARADTLHRLGLAVVDWDPDEPLDAALDGLARQRRRPAS